MEGVKDLAVTNNHSADVSVLLGRGDGTFGRERRFAVAFSPGPMAVADFNNDRTLDLAVGNGHSDVISILLGRGDGTFEPERRFLSGRVPASLISGDFNEDGVEDLVVANTLAKDIWVLLNQRPDADGDGFRPPEDCDESDIAINPAVIELPGNFVDENCDGDLGKCDPCSPWTNHGEYVNCVARAVKTLFGNGMLSPERRDVLLRSAATSRIGKSGTVPAECIP
jgi:hypothetical protein